VSAVSQMRIRGLSLRLPELEEDDLEAIDVPGDSTETVAGFDLGPMSVTDLILSNLRLSHGRIRRCRAERTEMQRVSLNAVDFIQCDLASLRWADGKIARTRFSECRFFGAQFEGLALEHVLFVDCKLDYAQFTRLRASGPVAFINCSLQEAEFGGCALPDAVLDGCDLSLTSFGEGNYRGTDLQGNDISYVRGASNLKNVVLQAGQLIQLGESLAAELKVTFEA
jgi:uncharacterized protein YjbI with pentapeptide repeats